MSFLRRFMLPANESHMGVALSLSAVVMAMLLWIIVYQSDVIAQQRDIIRWLWTVR